MTEWLIHFTRDTQGQSARDVLRTILIEGVLRPGFAVRGSPPRATVYGRFPAVCFSEQPLSMFLEYLSARSDPGAMASYGILIHKHDVYAAGGLPVIYGLAGTSELQHGDPDFDASYRLLNVSSVPYHEQYRYVAFAPNRTPYPLDWSHEREWRWSSKQAEYRNGLFWLGLDFFSTATGSYDGRVHVFVRYDADIAWLQEQLQAEYDANRVGNPLFGVRPEYIDQWRQRLPEIKVLSLETVETALRAGDLRFTRFETVPAEALHELVRPLAAATP